MDKDVKSIFLMQKTKKVVISDCAVSNFGLKSNVYLDIFELSVDYKEDLVLAAEKGKFCIYYAET